MYFWIIFCVFGLSRWFDMIPLQHFYTSLLPMYLSVLPKYLSVGHYWDEAFKSLSHCHPCISSKRKEEAWDYFKERRYTLVKGIHFLPCLGAHEDVHKIFPHSSTCWILLLEYVVRHFRSARQLSEWNTVRKIICWRNHEFSPIHSTQAIEVLGLTYACLLNFCLFVNI